MGRDGMEGSGIEWEGGSRVEWDERGKDGMEGARMGWKVMG